MKTLIAITLLTATLAQAIPQYIYTATTLNQYEETRKETWGFMPANALSMSKQKIQVKEPYQAEEIDIETGETNTVTRYHIIPISDCRWIPTDLLPRKATQAELDEVATAIAQAQILAETTRQEAKSDSLKAVENNFLALCDSLTGTTAHTKLSFAEINAIGTSMPDQTQMVGIAIQLLSIDAEAKTIGGLSWWYDCAWHPEIIEAE